MGKSRLIAEFVRGAAAGGGLVAFGECQAFGTQAELLRLAGDLATLFRLDPQQSDEEQVRALEARARRDRSWARRRVRRCSGRARSPDPGERPHRRFDAKLRKTSLEGLARECLRARAAEEPWWSCWRTATGSIRCRATCSMRSSAHRRRCRSSSCWPTGRPPTPGGDLGLESLTQFVELTLDELDAERRRAADPLQAGAAVRRRRGRARRSRPARHRALAGQPLLRRGAAQLRPRPGHRSPRRRGPPRLELPESLHSLILSRIDTLDEAPRRTLKVASVIGRVVPRPMLPAVYPELGSPDDVARTSSTLRCARARSRSTARRRRPTSSSTSSPRRWRTGACRTRSARSCTTRSATTSRRAEADAIDRHLDLLAHHYWNSENLREEARVPDPRRRGGADDLRERRRDRLPRARGAARRRGGARRPAPEARQGRRARRRLAARRGGRGGGTGSGRDAGRRACARLVRDGARRSRAETGPLRRGARAPPRAARGVRVRRATTAVSRRCATCWDARAPSRATIRRRSRTTTRA